jgi:hypothetical protein
MNVRIHLDPTQLVRQGRYASSLADEQLVESQQQLKSVVACTEPLPNLDRTRAGNQEEREPNREKTSKTHVHNKKEENKQLKLFLIYLDMSYI